jgi:hypothetical protein
MEVHTTPEPVQPGAGCRRPIARRKGIARRRARADESDLSPVWRPANGATKLDELSWSATDRRRDERVAQEGDQLAAFNFARLRTSSSSENCG